MGGAVAATGLVLTGKLHSAVDVTYSDFSNCGQGLREGGDVKLRGVLVGRIGGIERVKDESGQANCRVTMNLFPDDRSDSPSNSGAQIRAKTVFGEKWVELLYPDSPADSPIAVGDIIPEDRTIDPLEVETILNTALPLLDAIDPDHLSGALQALAGGFVGHEDAAITGIQKGIEALAPLNRNTALLKEGIRQLAESSAVFSDVDDDLLRAMANLNNVQQFTVERQDLLRQNLEKAPELLRELSDLFETRFEDFSQIANHGATVVSVLAARSDDLDRLLNILPTFNSNWIKNLNHVCRFRQQTDEPGKSAGDVVPGRCWRVHNLISESRGAYPPGKQPKPNGAKSAAGPTSLKDLLFLPTFGSGVRL
jgi:virulence factor Mce-like protein